jgi:predicted TIM-barrel fold metal-dependent hydrolase
MIVDCHAHVFAHWQGACGHPSRAVHLKYLQKVVTRPAARAFRVRDGLEIKPTMLFRPDDNTWAGLTDVGFRVGRFGQLCFTYEGDDYYVQYLPVGMQELVCPPELMLAQMTNAAVDHCILQAGGGYGAMNDYNAHAQHQYPQKFSGLLHVDEALTDHADVQAEVDRAVNVLGLRGLYYAQDFSRHGYARNVNHPAFGAFWDRIVGYRLPVFIELSSTPTYDRTGYLANLLALDLLLVRYPAHRFLLVMGPPAGHFATSGHWEFPPEALTVYKRDNLQLEIMFPISWGARLGLPLSGGAAAHSRHARSLRRVETCVGIGHAQRRAFCTYRQCVDYVRKHCGFLTDDEKALILGGNAADLIGLNGQALRASSPSVSY